LADVIGITNLCFVDNWAAGPSKAAGSGIDQNQCQPWVSAYTGVLVLRRDRPLKATEGDKQDG
jgi:hypothetical protein